MGRLKAQGYLYGQPEDAEAVRARLKAVGKLTGVSNQTPGQIELLKSAVRQPLLFNQEQSYIDRITSIQRIRP